MSAGAAPVYIAQLSDLHVTAEGRRDRNGFDNAAGLQRCLAHLSTLEVPPDLVVASGDLAELGTEAEYRRLRALVAGSGIPLLLLPGNHDHRAALRAAFADDAAMMAQLGTEGPVFHHCDVGGLRVVALDTVVEDAPQGRLEASQLRQLAALLAGAPAVPVLLFLHHPPVATGFARMDRIALEADSAAALGALLAHHPQVRGLCCGHVHRGAFTLWQGRPVAICPSTAFQAQLRLGGGRFEPAPDAPPGYLLHRWDGTTLVTHSVAVQAR